MQDKRSFVEFPSLTSVQLLGVENRRLGETQVIDERGDERAFGHSPIVIRAAPAFVTPL
jgi:hypothetical protein